MTNFLYVVDYTHMTNIRIFEVGGSIRNELLGRPASDRDFAVLAPSYDAMKDYLLSQGATIFQERPQFVAIRAKLPQLGAVDFTLARKESFYTDGRHPDTVYPAETLEDDLARRDFRFNAMAREVGTTTLIDPFDGQSDLHNHIINTVGNPSDRLGEDYLRCWRCLRFSILLDFTIEPNLNHCLKNIKPEKFSNVSSERIQVELEKMFMFDTYKSFYLMAQYPFLFQTAINRGIKLKPSLQKNK